MEDTPLKLEAGKAYITRNGLVTSRLKNITYAGNYRFEGEVDEYPGELPTICTWLSSGIFLTEGMENRLDLITEAPEYLLNLSTHEQYMVLHFGVEEVHITQIKPGDTIIHLDNHLRTVGRKDIKRSLFTVKSLFGDSYKAGSTPVKKLNRQSILTRFPGNNIKGKAFNTQQQC